MIVVFKISNGYILTVTVIVSASLESYELWRKIFWLEIFYRNFSQVIFLMP